MAVPSTEKIRNSMPPARFVATGGRGGEKRERANRVEQRRGVRLLPRSPLLLRLPPPGLTPRSPIFRGASHCHISSSLVCENLALRSLFQVIGFSNSHSSFASKSSLLLRIPSRARKSKRYHLCAETDASTVAAIRMMEGRLGFLPNNFPTY